MQVSGRPIGQQTGQAPVKPLMGRPWLNRGETIMPCGPGYPMKGKKKKKGNPHAMKKKKKKKGKY
jgi:hypothetical protein